MIVAQIVVFALGVVLAVYVLQSAVRTVVLPRGARSWLGRVVFGGVAASFDVFAARTKAYETEDRIRAFVAPVGLLANVAAWLVLMLSAFMLMFWAVDPDAGWGGAFHLSGSSITTLGFAPADSTIEQVLAFTVAGFGLLLLTLLITYLPSIYGAFSRRERKVGLLEVRAGAPPNALEFLLRYHRIGWLDRLDEEWQQWEEWFAEIEESHTTYPALAFFRSPDPHRSWVTAGGAVLDTASLYASTLETPTNAPAGVCIRAGYIALRRIAEFFGIPFDPDPSSDGPISISRDEYDEVYEALVAEGLSVRQDQEEAWRDFVGWRVNYDTVLLSLAEMVHAPYAPWTNDRSPPDHHEHKAKWFWPSPLRGSTRQRRS